MKINKISLSVHFDKVDLKHITFEITSQTKYILRLKKNSFFSPAYISKGKIKKLLVDNFQVNSTINYRAEVWHTNLEKGKQMLLQDYKSLIKLHNKIIKEVLSIFQ